LGDASGLSIKWAYDVGCASAGYLPRHGLFPGYTGAKEQFTAGDLDRLAERGFLAYAISRRTNRDASARQVYDFVDGISEMAARFPGIVHPSICAATAYSGGGGDLLNLLCKFPGLISYAACYFGLGDYGVDPVNGWWAFGSGVGSQAYLATDIGGSPAALPSAYAARDVRPALASALSLCGAGAERLYMYHSPADTAVSVETSRQTSALLTEAGVAHTYTETADAAHGYPSDNGGILQPLEWAYATAALTTPAATLPTSGSCLVLGWIEMPNGIRLWLDDDSSTGNPRTNGTGGRNRVATLAYDTEAGTLRITPMWGAQRCYARINGVEAEVYLDGNKATIVDDTGRVQRLDPDFGRPPWAPGPVAWGGPATMAMPVLWPIDTRPRTVIV